MVLFKKKQKALKKKKVIILSTTTIGGGIILAGAIALSITMCKPSSSTTTIKFNTKSIENYLSKHKDIHKDSIDATTDEGKQTLIEYLNDTKHVTTQNIINGFLLYPVYALYLLSGDGGDPNATLKINKTKNSWEIKYQGSGSNGESEYSELFSCKGQFSDKAEYPYHFKYLYSCYEGDYKLENFLTVIGMAWGFMYNNEERTGGGMAFAIYSQDYPQIMLE